MKVLVIGGGPSGVHFAQTALEIGHDVTLVDMGFTGSDPLDTESDFVSLKDNLGDPVRHFLGQDYHAIELPLEGDAAGVFGFPASKTHVFRHPPAFRFETRGFRPLLSFAAGGLAECWTAGAYPFTDADLGEFPFSETDLRPYYEIVSERIGVGGAEDDLSPFLPGHGNLSEPIELDESSARLLARYQRDRDRIQDRNPGAYFGRSRQAALSGPLGDRSGCHLCGRCLWGCPTGALYTPSLTLAQLRRHPRFTYVDGVFASHFNLTGDQVDALSVINSSGTQTYSADAYALACGTVATANLVLRTIFKRDGEVVRLDGLMDNRQVLAPFLNLSMLGTPYDPKSYQYHQLALGLDCPDPSRYVHGQVTTLTTATAHPVIQQLPVGMRQARAIFTILRSALGVVNLNFADTRRPENYITLNSDDLDQDGWPRLSLNYVPHPDQKDEIASALKRLKRLHWDLGAPLIPGMTKTRPMGSSVHYTGTLPMTSDRRPFTVSASGRSHDFSNLLVVDGSNFPALPAKNLTFSLMANATRMAKLEL